MTSSKNKRNDMLGDLASFQSFVSGLRSENRKVEIKSMGCTYSFRKLSQLELIKVKAFFGQDTDEIKQAEGAIFLMGLSLVDSSGKQLFPDDETAKAVLSQLLPEQFNELSAAAWKTINEDATSTDEEVKNSSTPTTETSTSP